MRRARDRGRRAPAVTAVTAAAAGRGTILGLRCSTAWRDWLDGLAEHCRLHKVDVIDLAVVAYAHRVGYKEAPPRR